MLIKSKQPENDHDQDPLPDVYAERENMLDEEISGLEQELERYEKLILEQMDEEAQKELANLAELIAGEEERFA